MYLKYLLLSAFTLSCLWLQAQAPLPSTVAVRSLTISRDSTATVLGWFKLIEKQGTILSYNATRIDLSETVQLPQKQYTLEEFLRTVLRRYDYEAEFTSRSKVLLQIKGKKHFTFSGKICSQTSGEPLNDAVIHVSAPNGNKYTAFSGSDGSFQLKLPYGSYRLKATYIGYTPFSSALTVNKSVKKDIEMAETSFPLKDAKVKTSPLADAVNYKGATGTLSASHNDPLVQIHSMPGITGTSVSGDLHVNGGQNDENLILMDGIPVYHSHHNNALLAQFNGEAVQKVLFFDSFIPAQYEGRLSSVTDVRIKQGDSLQHHQNIGIDLPSASLHFEGPIVRNKFTYMLSGRHSWIDFMKDLFTDTPNTNRTFNDLTGKMHFQVNPRLAVEALFYQSKNQYNDSINGFRNHKILEWKNKLCSMSCHAILPRQIASSTSISYTAYTNSIYAPVINIPTQAYIGEGMKNVTFKSVFSKRLDEYVDFSWGLSAARERYNLLASKDTVDHDYQKVTQLSGFLNTKLKITDRLLGSVALNLVSYLPDNSKKFFSVQPRFTLKYWTGKKHFLSFDFSRMEQFYHNLCVGEIPIPTDLRMPSIKGFRPSSSVHFEIGWRRLGPHWRTGISTFYKRRYHILGIRYQFQNDADNGWNRFIMSGNAESYGLKVHSLSQWNNWQFDCSYTFSRSMEWFKAFNNNQKNPTLHDVPHIFHGAVCYKTGKHSSLALGGYIKSGTLVNVYNDSSQESGAFISNRERQKTNYRLDLNFSSSKTSKSHKVKVSYKLGLYNIIGNPKENEIIDLYTTDTHKHALPYFTLNLHF